MSMTAIVEKNILKSGAVGRSVNRYWSVGSSQIIKGSRDCLEQETIPSLLSTGWFQGQL